MIINEVILENYLCYYGRKKFKFSQGLNIILGENGEGKTKFYEAIEWLFQEDNDDTEALVSKKAISEANVNGSFEVSVALEVELFSEKKLIKKSFKVNKLDSNQIKTERVILKGTEENNRGERAIVDGGQLLDQVFPPQFRKYSMFKGEEALNIFENEDALGILIGLFSEAKHYEKYAHLSQEIRLRADKAVDIDTKLNVKNKQEYERLEWEIDDLRNQEEQVQNQVENSQKNIHKIKSQINEVQRHVSNAETLEKVNIRIDKMQSKIKNIEGS